MSSPDADSSKGKFPQTRWSVVLEAQDDDPEALAKLCQAYWYPLYGYARRSGLHVEDAEDLTQAYFERLLKNEGLKQVQQGQGKLRSFLLMGLKNFATEQWRRHHAEKRGGHRRVVAMDALSAEERLAFEPSDTITPEIEFERCWARELMDRALAEVKRVYEEGGKSDVFAALSDQLGTAAPSRSYEEIGVELGVSEGAARFRAFKLRQRFRAALKELVLETVATLEEADEEIAYLLKVFEAPAA